MDVYCWGFISSWINSQKVLMGIEINLPYLGGQVEACHVEAIPGVLIFRWLFAHSHTIKNMKSIFWIFSIHTLFASQVVFRFVYLFVSSFVTHFIYRLASHIVFCFVSQFDTSFVSRFEWIFSLILFHVFSSFDSRVDFHCSWQYHWDANIAVYCGEVWVTGRRELCSVN